MCAALSPLLLPTNERGEKENKGSVSHQLSLKADGRPNRTNLKTVVFYPQEWPSDGYYVVCIKLFTLVSLAFIHHRLI